MYLNYHKMFAYVLLVYDLPTNLKDLLVVLLHVDHYLKISWGYY